MALRAALARKQSWGRGYCLGRASLRRHLYRFLGKWPQLGKTISVRDLGTAKRIGMSEEERGGPGGGCE